jgi:hypothetical protein
MLEIPYNDLEKLLDEDIISTLAFYGHSGKIFPLTNLKPSTGLSKFELVSRLGFFLDFNLFMNDNLKSKFIASYNILVDVFKKAKDKNGNWIAGLLTVRFITQNGSVFEESYYIDKSYGQTMGFKKYSFNFDPSKPSQVSNAVISILFYLFTVL